MLLLRPPRPIRRGPEGRAAGASRRRARICRDNRECPTGYAASAPGDLPSRPGKALVAGNSHRPVPCIDQPPQIVSGAQCGVLGYGQKTSKAAYAPGFPRQTKNKTFTPPPNATPPTYTNT